MKFLRAVLLAALAATCLFAFSQNTTQNPGKPPTSATPAQTPEAPKPQSGTPQTPAPTPPDYSQEAFVTERYHTTMRFENDGTGREQLDARIKIVSESGVQALGQLKVGYSQLSDNLDIAYVRVIKPDGSVVTAQASAVQDLTLPDAPVYTDYHEKHISVPSLRPGDILEYQFVRTIAHPLSPGQFWTSYKFSDHGIVLDEQLEINLPKDREIKLKTKPGYDAKITEEGDRRIYRWTHSNLEDKDDNSLSAKKKKKKKKLSDDERVPSVQLSTFKSWEEFGGWYASLEKDRRQPDAAVTAKAKALIQGKTDDMAKVKALYDYVSRNFRYVSLSFGLGRYQPHAASEVLDNGYGDCKDKNTLLASLLKAAGFQATSVLIGTQIKLDPDVPSPSQFDHVITEVSVDGQNIWLDSTTGINPFRMLAAPIRDKQALAILPDNKSHLVTTPADLPFEAFDHTLVDGEVNDSGKLTAHVTTNTRGDVELAIRYALRQLPSNRWKDMFEYSLRSRGVRGAEVSNVKTGDPTDVDNPLHVEFDIVANNYFDWSAPESTLELPLAAVSIPSVDDDDDTQQDEPIKLGSSNEEADIQVKLKLPAKYSVRLPIGITVKRDYAEYSSTYKFQDGELSSGRVMKIIHGEVPLDRTQDYAAFRRAVLADTDQDINLENKAPGTAGIGANESADDLNDSATQALTNQHYDLAVEMYQRVVQLEPKHKTAWNNLGRAYMALGQAEKAVSAFQKQIEINPYDEYAYSNLGLAYQQQQRYDDAIKQFQKQLELNPLDPAAHAYLGSLYVNLKKFPEAVPELEKAVELQPKNPLLQISLGQAYIATNQTDKGMASFDKAISVAPSPLIWNNIAYSLSEENVQLERAETYADEAISALQVQLNDLNFANLRTQDIAVTRLLFAVWDTKGWIAFQRGKVDEAEHYIQAAWLSGGSGDEAEHLGEIAEKRGKRDEAIRYYVDSLAVEQASPDAKVRLTAMNATQDLDRRIADAQKQMQLQRTTKLKASGSGSADFFFLVSPGKIEQVKFVRGDDSLKNMADSLQKVDIGMKFPSDAQVKVLRRGTVRCGDAANAAAGAKASDKGSSTKPADGPCTLEILSQDMVRSLD